MEQLGVNLPGFVLETLALGEVVPAGWLGLENLAGDSQAFLKLLLRELAGAAVSHRHFHFAAFVVRFCNEIGHIVEHGIGCGEAAFEGFGAGHIGQRVGCILQHDRLGTGERILGGGEFGLQRVGLLLGAFGAGGELVHSLGELLHGGCFGRLGVFLGGLVGVFLGGVFGLFSRIGRIRRILGGLGGIGVFGLIFWGVVSRGLIRDCFLVGLGGRRSLINGRELDSQRVDDFADAECCFCLFHGLCCVQVAVSELRWLPARTGSTRRRRVVQHSR